MKDNYEEFSKLRSKISEEQFKECMNNCSNAIEKDGVLYCTNKICRSNKKRINTRRRNIIVRSKWYEVETKVNSAENRLFDDPIFPYITLEAIIEHIYDEDIKNIIANMLGIPVSKLKTEGMSNIYKLNKTEIKKIIELIIIRMIGFKRAEQIVKNKIRK